MVSEHPRDPEPELPFRWGGLLVLSVLCMIVAFLADPDPDRPMTPEAWGILAIAVLTVAVQARGFYRHYRWFQRQRDKKRPW